MGTIVLLIVLTVLLAFVWYSAGYKVGYRKGQDHLAQQVTARLAPIAKHMKES